MRQIDGKYHIEGERIINTHTGEEIPVGEPLALFRAQDKLAGPMLFFYKDSALCAGCSREFRKGVDKLLTKFAVWAELNPGRMKLPD